MSTGRTERSAPSDGSRGGSTATEGTGADHLRAAGLGALGAASIAFLAVGVWLLAEAAPHHEAVRRSRAAMRLLELSTIAFCPSGRPERHPGSYRTDVVSGVEVLPLRFAPSPSRLLVEPLPLGHRSAGDRQPPEQP